MFAEDDHSGYRLTLQGISEGSTANSRQIFYHSPELKYSNPFHDEQFSVRFNFRLSQSNLSTRVIRLKSIFESLAEIMGFLAGFSFISRMTKHILVENGVGADADKHVQDHIKRQQRLRDERH